MCGIVGLFSYHNQGVSQYEFNNIFRQMVYSGGLRGMHGTGAFAIDEDSSQMRVRVGGPPHQLLGAKGFDDFEKFVKRGLIRFVVGHNRYATSGARTTEHTHPFRDKEITLVHNGTLRGYSHLPDSSKYAVDSEALTHAISEDGIDKTIEGLNGAWALVYWDGKDKTLNLLRNNERPLFLAFHEGMKLYSIASEKEMLEWLLIRNSLENFEITEVPEDTLMSFSLDKIKPKIRPLKSKAYKKQTFSYYEGLFSETVDVLPSKEEEQKDTDSKKKFHPVVVANSSNYTPKQGALSGDWGRGKTGQVYPQKKQKPVDETKQYSNVLFVGNVAKEQIITVKVLDFENIKDDPEFFRVIGQCHDLPGFEFRCNVRGQATLEALMEATHGLRAKVNVIMRSMRPTAEFPHIVHLTNPEPAYEKQTKPTVN